jgi:DNA-binding response OmpR family regulator
MRGLILLVDPSRTALDRAAGLLHEAGYRVVTSSSFRSARDLLRSVKPDLLITAVRLGEFNGLHLVVLSRDDTPHPAVILTHDGPDPMLELEATRLNAMFLGTPLAGADLLPCVREALSAHDPKLLAIRRWPRKQLASAIDARIGRMPVRFYDVSYGGVRLVVGEIRDLPVVLGIIAPAAAIAVNARKIWTSRSDTGEEFWCGAHVIDSGAAAAEDWRRFVDAVQ